MGAPAITGAPVVHSQDTAQPLDDVIGGKRGAGLLLVYVTVPNSVRCATISVARMELFCVQVASNFVLASLSLIFGLGQQ